MSQNTETTGQCLCGAVQFSGTLVEGRGVGVCHCGQCRRWGGGGPFMAVRFAGGVDVTAGDALTWFASSSTGERGFCARCGSSLFWRDAGEPKDWAINVATLPENHGEKIREHIWIDDKPDFYDFADNMPRKTAAQCLRQED